MTQAKAQEQKAYVRFDLFERVEHFILIFSFSILGVTGLVQKFSLAGVSQAIIAALGGIETTRIIHHVAAAIFLLEAVYHFAAMGYRLLVQRKQATMIPTIKDGLDAVDWVKHNLGLADKGPKMPRYNFMEKMEYLAVIWGLIIMAITGLMLWNPIFVTRFLPGVWIPAAKAAHGGEALLAVLAIIIWHFYNVHIKHWNWAMLKGTLTHEEMAEEHGQELDEIQTGRLPEPPPTEVVRRRAMFYVPVSIIFILGLSAVIYYALTFETTSVTTLPPAERAQVYVPATQTPMAAGQAQATPVPGAVTSIAFNGTIDAMLKSACGACHGDKGGFNAETYKNVMKEVKVGSPYDSRIVQIQKIGTHPGQLSSEQLNTLIAWIQAGAPETPGGSTSASTGTTGAAAATTWDAGISTLFTTKCGACHGTAGGFTAKTYADVVKQLKPGDPDNSNIVIVQKKGGHPGQFSADELNQVIAWIKAGAPEK